MLSDRQNEILRALVNRIIPADDDPGGWEAGVGDYLAGQFNRDLRHVESLYALGLESLDAEARAVFSLPFDSLPDSLQDELLTRIEAGRVETLWVVQPAAFFMMVVNHCAEGFYSDPGNGGNRDGVAWKMIGFEVRG
jgi:hypothetical protein